MRVIIKHPEEQVGRIADIKNDLKTLQRIVGGCIEVVPFGLSGDVIICNEEGKVKDLPENVYVSDLHDVICGTMIICKEHGEDLTDTPYDIEAWENILRCWNFMGEYE